MKYFKNIFLLKDKSWSPSPIFSKQKKIGKIQSIFNTEKWLKILRCSRRLFIILVSLTVTLFSGKILISTRWFFVQFNQKILKGLYSKCVQYHLVKVLPGYFRFQAGCCLSKTPLSLIKNFWTLLTLEIFYFFVIS